MEGSDDDKVGNESTGPSVLETSMIVSTPGHMTDEEEGDEAVQSSTMVVVDGNSNMSQSSEDVMEIQTQQTSNTNVSSIGNTTNFSSTGSEVYTTKGGHGEFHHRQKNPRKRVVSADKEMEKMRQMRIFAGIVTNGDVVKVQEIQRRFDELNATNRTSATSFLSSYCLMGCKESLMQAVFGIGYGRYCTARDGPKEVDEHSSAGGRNNNAFGDADRLHLQRFVTSKFFTVQCFMYLSVHTYACYILIKFVSQL